MEKEAQQCAQLIQEAENIAVLTGAGISTSAGIPDFRGPQGLYITRRYDPDKIFDIQCFFHDPEPFYDFARDFVALEEQIQATPAHRFLTHLEEIGKLKGIVTQNIDFLHQRAGSRNVVEMHGSFCWSSCLECHGKFSYEQIKQKLQSEKVPHCECGGIVKPDIVFFGEGVRNLPEAIILTEKSDLFFVIGTSCVVYPAAMLPSYATGKIIVINNEKVDTGSQRVVLAVEADIDSFSNKVSEYLPAAL